MHPLPVPAIRYLQIRYTKDVHTVFGIGESWIRAVGHGELKPSHHCIPWTWVYAKFCLCRSLNTACSNDNVQSARIQDTHDDDESNARHCQSASVHSCLIKVQLSQCTLSLLAFPFSHRPFFPPSLSLSQMHFRVCACTSNLVLRLCTCNTTP